MIIIKYYSTYKKLYSQSEMFSPSNWVSMLLPSFPPPFRLDFLFSLLSFRLFLLSALILLLSSLDAEFCSRLLPLRLLPEWGRLSRLLRSVSPFPRLLSRLLCLLLSLLSCILPFLLSLLLLTLSLFLSTSPPSLLFLSLFLPLFPIQFCSPSASSFPQISDPKLESWEFWDFLSLLRFLRLLFLEWWELAAPSR